MSKLLQETNDAVLLETGDFLLLDVLAADYTMAAAQGSIVLNGQSLLLHLGRKIIAGIGSFALTSIDVTFNVHIANIIMLVDTGLYALTGQNIMFNYGYKILTDYGSYLLNGQNVILNIGRKMIAGLGEYALTGQNIVLSIGKKMSAAVGSFILNGQNVILNLGWKMSAAQGSIALNGQNVLLKIGKMMSVSVGSFILTGQNILIHLGWKMPTATGLYTLTGFNTRVLLNGISNIWTAVTKHTVSSVSNITKNVATWIAQSKS